MPKVVKTKEALTEELKKLKEGKKSTGFVPTMGALHQGHLSLIRKCQEENDLVIVSIFVNPTQFNDKKDLANYPRKEEADLQKLNRLDVDLIFYPDDKEMYPEGVKKTDYKIGALANKLEGKHRPGHFQGVVTVVQKFFDLIQPDKAYFGQKDFQQYLVIKKMVEDLNQKVEIILFPTVREKDGLAMSSRNVLLNLQDRKRAPILFKTLNRAKVKLMSQEVSEVKEWAMGFMESYPGFKAEYFEVLDLESFKPLTKVETGKKYIVCGALQIDNVRLIDNIIIS